MAKREQYQIVSSRCNNYVYCYIIIYIIILLKEIKIKPPVVLYQGICEQMGKRLMLPDMTVNDQNSQGSPRCSYVNTACQKLEEMKALEEG